MDCGEFVSDSREPAGTAEIRWTFPARGPKQARGGPGIRPKTGKAGRMLQRRLTPRKQTDILCVLQETGKHRVSLRFHCSPEEKWAQCCLSKTGLSSGTIFALNRPGPDTHTIVLGCMRQVCGTVTGTGWTAIMIPTGIGRSVGRSLTQEIGNG